MSLPSPFVFNHGVGMDVFEVLDATGKRFSMLNAVCMGTTYDQSWIVRESESLRFSVLTGVPESLYHWLELLGARWPKLMRYDTGTHSRGIFTGRTGSTKTEWKGRATKVVQDTHAAGADTMDMILGELFGRC